MTPLNKCDCKSDERPEMHEISCALFKPFDPKTITTIYYGSHGWYKTHLTVQELHDLMHQSQDSSDGWIEVDSFNGDKRFLLFALNIKSVEERVYEKPAPPKRPWWKRFLGIDV